LSRRFTDAFLLVLKLAQLLLAHERLLPEVGLVIARVAADFAALQIQDAGGHMVQCAAVVGDDEDRGLAALQVGLQPLARFEIKVVFRFVQQEQVGILQEHERQHEARALSAAQGLEGKFKIRRGKAQAMQHLLDARAEFITAARDEGILHAGVFLQHVFARGHAFFEFGQLLLLRDDIVEGMQHDIEDGEVRGDARNLGERGEARAFHAVHKAAVRLHLAGDDAEDGGLAGAVAANQANAFAHLNAKIHIDKNRFPGEGL
jgi:hypothetical protein